MGNKRKYASNLEFVLAGKSAVARQFVMNEHTIEKWLSIT
jgi:hypothetical protein